MAMDVVGHVVFLGSFLAKKQWLAGMTMPLLFFSL